LAKFFSNEGLITKLTGSIERGSGFQSKNLSQFTICAYSYCVDRPERLILPDIVHQRSHVDNEIDPL
jgi:hypothetical protein